MADNVLLKLQSHTWYLNEILVGLAVFDENIESEIKIKMVSKFVRNRKLSVIDISNVERILQKIPLKAKLNKKEILSLNIEDFVTENTIIFFQILFTKFGYNFLLQHPDTWTTNENYMQCKQVISSLHVVNDLAERNVGLMKNYNGVLSNNEEQKQSILQVVEHARRNIPCTATKQQIINGLNKI